ncbi:MAG: zinc ribbon domain-containing protein [Syntrophales bacterium LBB04]|nr:zinc ribbon domain-containing protein [Syntrophales bacterium LBB04]
MPIYEFRCNACGNVFERLVFSGDKKDNILCPSCGGSDTCKLMSAFSCPVPSSDAGLGSSASSSCSTRSGGFS